MKEDAPHPQRWPHYGKVAEFVKYGTRYRPDGTTPVKLPRSAWEDAPGPAGSAAEPAEGFAALGAGCRRYLPDTIFDLEGGLDLILTLASYFAHNHSLRS